jgi:hypothetical protein
MSTNYLNTRIDELNIEIQGLKVELMNIMSKTIENNALLLQIELNTSKGNK